MGCEMYAVGRVSGECEEGEMAEGWREMANAVDGEVQRWLVLVRVLR